MKFSEMDDAAREAFLRRVRESASGHAAVMALQGEVLELRVTGGPAIHIAFRNGTIALDAEAEPTIAAEATADVLDRVFAGELDPLVAILTRRLKATIDPLRGPLLRQILAAGREAGRGDMGWDQLFGVARVR